MAPDRLRGALLAELSAVGITLSTDQISLLSKYLGLVSRWRRRARLTAVADPIDAARVHIADSLLVLRAGVPASASLIDVGSGAGFPGIPLKVARPDLDITLLEPEARRAAFLEVAATELSLLLRVVAARAEDAAKEPSLREQFDLAAARAVAPLPAVCELTLPFVRPGGKTVLLKGPSVRGELQDGRAAAHALGGGEPALIDVRLAGGERRVIVVIPKTGLTPVEFPRRSGIPQRRPLKR
ncbi:MAG: 16S rRNA (guanine(527)-N(7))-methyltransferase RsmG [Dehalococcoidia bacterium]|nr:16S rRNA (guanine(527)-N(7))-methyltransferase RsmG [Dehalococcoidia bacterium]